MAEGKPSILEEFRQLTRSLTEKVLNRAASDPQWKQQYLDDPEAATAEFPEPQRLRQMEEEQRRTRDLNEKVLDKAESDPQWKQQLLNDPEAAMRELSQEAAEVRGQVGNYEVYEVDTFQLGGLSIWGKQYYDVWFPTQQW